MASLYLVPALDGVTVGDQVSLGGAEGRHAVSVARVRVGETLRLGDGNGTVVTGPVVTTDRDALVLEVTAVDVSRRRRPR